MLCFSFWLGYPSTLCHGGIQEVTEEKDMITKDRSWEWMKNLAYRLADVIREIGDQFDIVREMSFDEDTEQ